MICKAVCSASCQNAVKFESVGEYVNCRTGMPCHLHTSASLQSGSEWLADLGPVFVSVKVPAGGRGGEVHRVPSR